jgi:hypothetical protein
VEKQYSGRYDEASSMAMFSQGSGSSGSSGGSSGDDELSSSGGSGGSSHSYDSYPHPLRRYPYQEDAFATIMQWLYDRIDKTR